MMGTAGAGLGSAVRELRKTERNRRVLRATLSGFQAFGKSVSKVIGQLWHEVTGFLFVCIAVIAGGAAYREYVAYQTGKIGPMKFVLGSVVTVMFLYFGVSNFRRARK